MMFPCRPRMSAMTNTMTDTPTPMPIRIRVVCARPSRRKRRAMVDSIHMVRSVELHRQFTSRRGPAGGRGLPADTDTIPFDHVRHARGTGQHLVAGSQAVEHFTHDEAREPEPHRRLPHATLA